MHRNRDRMDVKYINVGFRSEMVTHVTLGPRAANEAQLRRFLNESGFQGVEIRRSDIPLR